MALIVPTGVVGGLVSVLFPSHGQQPMAAGRIILPLLAGVVVAVTAPRDWRVLRAGGAVYALGVVLTWLIPSPVGTNVERMGALFGAPALLAIWFERRRRNPQPVAVPAPRRSRRVLPHALLRRGARDVRDLDRPWRRPETW
ncbi:hypothetical protein ACU686_14970 [Yinghuangia aomiensis]